MKILFISASVPGHQGDYLDVSILHGLRKILGEDCVDYPKLKILYHDFSDIKKESLHGRGFTIITHLLEDIDEKLRDSVPSSCFDAVIIGDKHVYEETISENDMKMYREISNNNIWYLDGHDLYGGSASSKHMIHDGEQVLATQFTRCFKRELVNQTDDVYPTGFGIAKEMILPINTGLKTQLIQKTAPSFAKFGSTVDSYSFTDEKEYYNDMSISWFGLTCKKGGWDCMRHYEILAAGALVLFRDYDKKPELCSPQFLPCFSYSSSDDLEEIMSRLVVNGQPTNEYIDILFRQREWLCLHGTTEARALKILQTIRASE